MNKALILIAIIFISAMDPSEAFWGRRRRRRRRRRYYYRGDADKNQMNRGDTSSDSLSRDLIPDQTRHEEKHDEHERLLDAKDLSEDQLKKILTDALKREMENEDNMKEEEEEEKDVSPRIALVNDMDE